jgi:DNA-binding transcriptional ArsR family regulator
VGKSAKHRASRNSRQRPKKPKPGVLPPLPELDRTIHEPVRLGIMSALGVAGRLSFAELKRVLSTSDGNLSVHARKLEQAGYVTCEKSFDGRTPLTEYELSSFGRKALTSYLTSMEALVSASGAEPC